MKHPLNIINNKICFHVCIVIGYICFFTYDLWSLRDCGQHIYNYMTLTLHI